MKSVGFVVLPGPPGNAGGAVVLLTAPSCPDRPEVSMTEQLLPDIRRAAAYGRLSEYGGMEFPMWTASGQRYARDAASGGAYESDVKSERVREAAERRAMDGRMNGPCPFGWRRE